MKLDMVPIYAGEMTFNEINNEGFDQNQIVTWSSDDLKVTTDGKVTGTIETSYVGPPTGYPLLNDFLFVQVRGDYQSNDITSEKLSDVIPLEAEESAAKTAKFSLNSNFRIPEIQNNYGRLDHIWITITWVRVYKQGNDYYFHVFAGDADRYPNTPSTTFNQEPKKMTGRFGYYQVLPESKLSDIPSRNSIEFDYHNWIKQHIQ